MTIRRMIFNKILDPEAIVEEIARLPGLATNAPGVVLDAIRDSPSYQAFRQHVQKLGRRSNLAEYLYEWLNFAVVGGFGIAMIFMISWGVIIPRLLCALPCIYAILSRRRFEGHYHVLVLTWILFFINLDFFSWMIYSIVDHRDESNDDFINFCIQTITSMPNGTNMVNKVPDVYIHDTDVV